MDERGVEQKNFAMEAGKPPLILIFDKGSVGPFDDDGDELVFGIRFYKGADVEFGGQTGILGETDGGAVEIDGEHAGCSAEMENSATPSPVGWDSEGAAINAGGIVGGNVRRQIGPGHLHVGVMRLAMPLHFPIAGHLDVVPVGCILVESGQGRFGMGGQLKLPSAIKRLKKRRAFALTTAGFFG